MAAADSGLPLSGVARLSHLGVIRVAGDDAAKFLHGQLTQDFSLLGQDQARLAAFCSAKGRMQASFIGFKRSATEVLLVCSQDLLATTLRRLSMFVLRAKAKLSDASAEFALYGICTPAQATDSPAPWSLQNPNGATTVALYPAVGSQRQLWIGAADAPPPDGPALSLERWLWSEVHSGVATLSQAVFEAFVPQMLNYESVGGVNFKKGCYPGQEVVARSQFRGTLKRRAFIAHSGSAVQAGQEIFNSNDAEQPVGLVVQVAPALQQGFDAIVCLQLSALESGSLHTESCSGPALNLLPLPYPLLEDL